MMIWSDASRRWVATFLFLGFWPCQEVVQAELIIHVQEDNVNSLVRFSWKGVIGDSGANENLSAATSADYLSGNGRLGVGDRSRTDVGDTGAGLWDSTASYRGTSSAFGSSSSLFTNFTVTADVSFNVFASGILYVGSVVDGGSDVADLSTQTFEGSFSLPGTFSTYGIFDTPGTDLDSGQVELWSADTGSGRIAFERSSVVPEPASTALLGVGLFGVLIWRKRQSRSKMSSAV